MVSQYCHVFSKYLKHLPQFIRKSHSEVASISSEVSGVKKKIKKPPFMKNIFLGVVDSDILSFPEVDLTEGNYLAENKDLQVQNKKGVSDNEKSFIKLLRSGICRLGFEEMYGGLPCHSTFTLRKLEELEISPLTSFCLETQYSHIIENISNFGNELQKKSYLRDLIEGTAIGAYALHEEDAGADPASIQCMATPNGFTTTAETSYILNGEKTWISNASIAKFFIVFAQVKESNRPTLPGLLSAFIVDRDTPGVEITAQENIMNEYDVYRVKFNNVELSSLNLLGNIGDGYNIATSTLESNKFIFSASFLSFLRKLSSRITIQCSKTNRFPVPFREYELVQFRISKIMSSLYALESSLYLLAGMKDLYEMDTSLESVIVQNLFKSHGPKIVNECLNLVGIRAFNNSDFGKAIKENTLLLSYSFACPEILKLYIALKGMAHAGSVLADTIVKARNPLDFPGFIIKRIFYTHRHSKDNPKLTKRLYMELHPSLKQNADQLEYCICRMQFSVENILAIHGKETVQRQIDLIRLSDIASDIFTMVAVLGRASRSYCTGIRFCDQEILVANSWCQEAMKRIKVNVSAIIGDKLTFTDHNFLKLAPDILQHKGYFFTSPVEKNIN